MKKFFKSKVGIALAVVLAVIVVLAVGMGVLFSSMPKNGGPRVAIGRDVVGVLTGFSYAWIVFKGNEAILIDTGVDEQAPAILAELKARGLGPDSVHTILLTHGHADHWLGAKAFPGAEVLVGPGDESIMRGTRLARGKMQKIFALFVTPKPPPRKIRELRGDELLTIAGERFQVVRIPGHSPGSVAFLWKDILFTGDSLMATGPDGVDRAPSWFSDDPDQNRASLRALLDLQFTTAADGHTGVIAHADQKLRALLKE